MDGNWRWKSNWLRWRYRYDHKKRWGFWISSYLHLSGLCPGGRPMDWAFQNSDSYQSHRIWLKEICSRAFCCACTGPICPNTSCEMEISNCCPSCTDTERECARGTFSCRRRRPVQDNCWCKSTSCLSTCDLHTRRRSSTGQISKTLWHSSSSNATWRMGK